MKQLSPLFAFLFLAHISFGQTSLVNFKEGTWKNKQSWLYLQIPADTNDVVLMHDIVVDTNAICRSLTTNGYNVTISNGFNLTITGRDTVAKANDDTLISKIEVFYSGDGSSANLNRRDYKFYEYDALKRISKIVIGPGFHQTETRYYYEGTNKLPYKTIFVDSCENTDGGSCNVQFDTSYYTYNDMGVVIKDSIRSLKTQYKLNYKQTNNYIVKNDSVIKYIDYNYFNMYGGNVYESFSKDTTYYYVMLENGNIVYQLDSNKTWKSEHICSYDNKNNPFFKSAVPIPIFATLRSYFEFLPQPNNFLSSKESYTSTEYDRVRHFKNTFKYNSNNYPSEIFVTDEVNNTITVLKCHYTK